MTRVPAIPHDVIDALKHAERVVYLASPYTHADQARMDERAALAAYTAGILIAHGVHVYSPIAHSHAIARLHAGTGHDWTYWKDLAHQMLKRCDAIALLQLPGWEHSTGVYSELEYARAQRYPKVEIPTERLIAQFQGREVRYGT